MAVTNIPNVQNWTVTPQNGQSGYFDLMNTWLGQSTLVIASLQSAITAQNAANSEINTLASQAESNAIIATGLANYQGVYSTLTTYSKGQSTSVGTLYYTSKVDGNSNHAVTDTNYWVANPINDKADKSGYTGFKNKIINGNKQINQSGLTSADNAYNYDNHYKVGNNWFMFINGKNIISGTPYTLSWDGIATASYYIGTAGALTVNAQSFTPIINGGTITPTITSAQILWIKFASNATGSTYTNVQLEPGSVSTSYEQRLYELEESLVQRVYEHGLISTLNLSASTSYQGGLSTAYFKTVKNIIPQITFTTNNGSKLAAIWDIGKATVQFKPTVQAGANDFMNIVVNVDARPY